MGGSLTRCVQPGPEASSSEEGSPNRATAASSVRRSSQNEITAMRATRLDVLRQYATVPDPAQSIPPSVLLHTTPKCIAIFDAYPKAKYHFLVLPRYPFPPNWDPESTDSIANLDWLDSLRSLLLKAPRAVREEVIAGIADCANDVVEMVKDEMKKTEGFDWGVDVGFHAIPSMNHLHLHVISKDRISDSLKTKKHYNSFRPDLGFFVSLQSVREWLDEEDAYIHARARELSNSEHLLSIGLSCNKCDEPQANIPALKRHLVKEFDMARQRGLRRSRLGEENPVEDLGGA